MYCLLSGIFAVDPHSGKTSHSRWHAAIVVLIMVFLAAICAGAIYFVGDLSKLQGEVAAQESRDALRDITSPDQLDQAIKRYPTNKLLALLGLAKRDADELETAARKSRSDIEAKSLPPLASLAGASRADLEALRRDAKAAQTNAAGVTPRFAASVKAAREKLESDAKSLHVDDERLSLFMTMIDEQHAVAIALFSQMLATHAEYYDAYDKCVALLVRDYGIYRVTNGQFIFPFQSTADSYNRAVSAVTAASDRMSQFDEDMKKFKQAQLGKWKAFADL